MDTCRHAGCPDPIKNRKYGYCNPHYQQFMKHGYTRDRRERPGAWLHRMVAEGDRSTGCWIWIGYTQDNNGSPQGKITYGGRTRLAHHVAMILDGKGDKPDGLEACHSCGVSNCVNPDHLRWDTHESNEADRVIHGTSNRGERCGLATITDDDVRRIRTDPKHDTEWAAELGCTAEVVRNARLGHTWGWMESPPPLKYAPPRGQQAGRSKLTLEQVCRIRTESRTLASFAEEFGVSLATVSHARTGRNWAWLLDPPPMNR